MEALKFAIRHFRSLELLCGTYGYMIELCNLISVKLLLQKDKPYPENGWQLFFELELFWSKGHCQQCSRLPPHSGGGFYPFAPEESSQNVSAWNPV
jgi:hypothetical protein